MPKIWSFNVTHSALTSKWLAVWKIWGAFFFCQQKYCYQCYSHDEKEVFVGRCNNPPRMSLNKLPWVDIQKKQCLPVPQCSLTKSEGDQPFTILKTSTLFTQILNSFGEKLPFSSTSSIAWDLRKNTLPIHPKLQHPVSPSQQVLYPLAVIWTHGVFSRQKYILNDRLGPLRALKMPGSCLKVVIGNCFVLTGHIILSLGLFLLHRTDLFQAEYSLPITIYSSLLFNASCCSTGPGPHCAFNFSEGQDLLLPPSHTRAVWPHQDNSSIPDLIT